MKPDPPDEFLWKAYLALRKEHWEGGFDAALNDPIRGRLIRGMARRIETGPPPDRQEKPANFPVNSIPSWLRNRGPIHGLDRKSLAAGEREDD